MSVIKTITFTCSDGKEFANEKLAEQHEENISRYAEALYEKWIRTSYSGKKLLVNHKLDEFGTWRIRGEDPNCDLGGAHYQPDLGTVEGKLEDVIKHAIKLPGFYTWGGGGDISKVEIRKL